MLFLEAWCACASIRKLHFYPSSYLSGPLEKPSLSFGLETAQQREKQVDVHLDDRP